MSFGDHLDELRSCMVRALVGVAVATGVSFVFAKDILQIIFQPLLVVQDAAGLRPELLALSPTAGFLAYLKIGFLSGLIVAMPWVLLQIWRFVATGLYQKERRFAKSFMPVTCGLFAIGVCFLYYIVLPVVLQFFIQFNMSFDLETLRPTAFQRLLLDPAEDAQASGALEHPVSIPIVLQDPLKPNDGDLWFNPTRRQLMLQTSDGLYATTLVPHNRRSAVRSQFAIDFYISFVLMLALAFGIAFELPVVVFFLAWSGIASTQVMAKARRYVLFGIVVLAAILTPPDVISQILLAMPMYLLFEIGLIAARRVEKRRAADREA